MFVGGADTIVATVLSYILAVVRNPVYQRRAQEELDRVVGPDRLPDFADREALPYIEAIIRETYRKYPIGPLGKYAPRQEGSRSEV